MTDAERPPAGPCTVNVPNLLTLTRIFLVPLLVIVLLTEFEGRRILGVPKEVVAAAIFALASVTDWLDGLLARRRAQVTRIGQMLDPLADKLLTSAALISLVQLTIAPAWMVTVIVGRELVITVLRAVAHTRGVSLPASPLGKIKMAAQVAAILLLVLGSGPLPWLIPAGHVFLWLSVAAALISAFDYCSRFPLKGYSRPLDAKSSRRPRIA